LCGFDVEVQRVVQRQFEKVVTSLLGVGDDGSAAMFRDEELRRTTSARLSISGLSRATGNQRLDTLVAAGLVVAADVTATDGRPASLFALNRNRGVLLLADIGATAMRNAVCNLRGEVIIEI
jgi:hypothetical protein